MKAFDFYLPTKIEYGCGNIERLPEILVRENIKKPCIISDEIILSQDFGKRIVEIAPNAVVYNKVIPNPTIVSVDDCTAFCRENLCDGLIALGGGSSIDTAKSASVCFADGTSVRYFLAGQGENITPFPSNILPVIAIPTTSGTGSEASQYAVITDSETLQKDSVATTLINPVCAIVDPEVTYGVPNKLTIATGLDVLGHALEAITSTIDNDFTDILAVEAIRKVFKWLPETIKGSEEARAEISMASTLAGIAMSHCCGTLPHGMGCPLSGHCGVPHGLAVGVLQVPTVKLIAEVSANQLDKLAMDLGADVSVGEGANWLVARIEQLFADCNFEPKLKDFDLSDAKIEAMIPDALVHGCTGLTPCEITEDMVRGIYRSLR